MRIPAVLFAVFLTLPAAAQTPPPGMATYEVAFLRRAQPSTDRELQKRHLAYLDHLEKSGVLVGAGPMAGTGDLRGVLILTSGSLARARELVGADPAVQAGVLSADVLRWWGPDDVGKGYAAMMKANPAAQPKMITYQLGLLKGGPVRNQPADEAEKIQAGHLAHIGAMSKTGKLVAAGPFLDDAGTLRGIFLFAATAEEARSLAADDPAIKAGRLVLDLHPWMVAEGVFTRRAAP